MVVCRRILGFGKDKMSSVPHEYKKWGRGLRMDLVKTTFTDPSWNTDQGVLLQCESTSSKLIGGLKENSRYAFTVPTFNWLLSVAWVRALWLRPERWWTILESSEVNGNSDGSSKRYWRANRSWNLSIGAKNQSNHLLAGSFWSFSQDSWNDYTVLSGKAND